MIRKHSCRLGQVMAAALVLVTSAAAPLPAQDLRTIRTTVSSAVSSQPISGAMVRLLSSGRSCTTGGDGSCAIAHAPRPDSVRVTARGYLPVTRWVAAESAAMTLNVMLVPDAVPLRQVVTIGTRGDERTSAGSAVPVDVLTRELRDASGVVETWEQLQRLVPSVNVPHIPIGDNHMRPVTLRGLAPHHVLVLVDGKRRHPASMLLAGPSVPNTSFTDVGAVPGIAIERIDVLRDGAAAQYGSDAIGGVVNLVLRTGAQRELRAGYGTTLTSDGGRTFRDGRSLHVGGTVGTARRDGAHVTLSGEVRERGTTNRAYADARQQYFAGDPRNDSSAGVSSHLGNGRMRSGAAFVTGSLPVGRTELYAFGGASIRAGSSPDAFFRRPLDPRTVRVVHPDGFLPVVDSRIGDLSLTTGVRGVSHGWEWDASIGAGGNRVSYEVRESNNASLGAATPVRFDAGRVWTGQWISNADVTRAVRLAARPARVSAGVEARLDQYGIGAGEPDSWRDGGVGILDGPASGQPAAAGAQGMVGYRPIDEVKARRTSAALYLDSEIHLHPRVLLQAAARSERFSDFGSTVNGKLAARIALNDALAWRGSVGSGFRAPSLAEQYFSSSRTVYQQVDGVNTVLTVRTFPVGTPEAQLLGAVPLRSENAVNASIGLVLDKARWPSLSADLFEVNIHDRIGLGGTVSDTAIIRRFAENGMRGIGGGNYFANAYSTRTRGVDVVATHGMPMGTAGIIRLFAGYNHARTVVTRIHPLPTQLAGYTAAVSGRTTRGILERGQPRETMLLTATYTMRALGVSITSKRSGPTAQLDQLNPAADQVVSARWITDARLSYQLRRRLELAVSATNLLDVYPDEWMDFKDGLQARGPSMQGIFRYPGALSPFGMNGRTVSLQFTAR